MRMSIQTMLPRAPGENPVSGIYRGLPAALQDLQSRPGSLEATLFWSVSANQQGMDRFRVFKDNETNLIQEIADKNARQLTVKLPGNSSAMFYVCAVSAIGREGPKLAVQAKTNTDLFVVTGTTGGTSGAGSAPDPTWANQASGGRYQGARLPNTQ